MDTVVHLIKKRGIPLPICYKINTDPNEHFHERTTDRKAVTCEFCKKEMNK